MKSLGNLTGNTQTTAITLRGNRADRVFGVDGTATTFGAAVLQIRPPGSAVWIALTPTLTAINTGKEIRVPLECDVRVALTGSTTVNLNFWLG